MADMGRSKKIGDAEFLREIAASPDPFVTPSELAERMDYTADGARRRLSDLEDKGYVRSRNVGARAKVWWITDEGRDKLR